MTTEPSREYILWIEEYEGSWRPVRCGDLPAVQREILKFLKDGKEPLITINVPYKFNVKIEEAEIGKVQKDKTKHDKDPGAEGDREVRRGDETAASGLDQPGGDHSPGDLPED